MLISKYLNQKCQLTIKSPGPEHYDRYGEPRTDTVLTIPCRREDEIVDVQTSTGTIVKSQSVYYLDRRPQEIDLIDGRPILKISSWVDFGGGSQGFKVIV